MVVVVVGRRQTGGELGDREAGSELHERSWAACKRERKPADRVGENKII